MKSCHFFAYVVILCLIAPIYCPAQFDRKIIDRGKAATALVEVDLPQGRGVGTAFCVQGPGLLITNAHVVDELRKNSTVKLVFRPGRGDQQIVEANVYRIDPSVDLALLAIDEAKSQTSAPDPKAPRSVFLKALMKGELALSLGRDSDLFETMQLNVFGFPLGKELALKRDTYPSVTVSSPRISSKQEEGGILKALLFDGQLLPGNSGGPVVDAEGKVVGVARATILGGDINIAIPVDQLAKFLKETTLMFDPPPLTWAKRSEPVTWSIIPRPARPGEKLPNGLSMVIRLTVNGQAREIVPEREADGAYRATFVPFPKETEPQAPTTREVKIDIELKSKAEVLASTHLTTQIAPTAGMIVRRPLNHKRPGTQPKSAGPPPPPVFEDQDYLKVTGPLAFDGVPIGAGGAIRPPKVEAGRPLVNFVDEATSSKTQLGLEYGGSHSIAFSPDGAHVLTVRSIRDVCLADTSTGSEEYRFKGHTAQVSEVAFSPDGRLALSASWDGTAKLWDVALRKERATLRGHQGKVLTAAFAPDGKLAATGGEDGTIRLWNVADGKEVGGLQGHTDAVSDVAFSPDGQSLASSSAGRQVTLYEREKATDLTVRLWKVATRTEVRSLKGHSNHIRAVAFTPDGRNIVSAGDDSTIRVWLATTGEQATLMKVPDRVIVTFLAISPDGLRLYSGGTNGITTWDIAKGSDLDKTYSVGVVDGMALSSDGRRLASTVESRGAYLQQIAPTLQKVGVPLEIPLVGKLGDVATGGGGRYLFLSFPDQKQLAVFDFNSASIVKSIPLVEGDALVAAGANVVVIAYPEKRAIERWDLATMSRSGPIVPLPIKAKLLALGMGSDSQGPLVAAWDPNGGQNHVNREPDRFSFLDPSTFGVLAAGPLSGGSKLSPLALSASGGSFNDRGFPGGGQGRMRIRVSAGGDLFTITQAHGLHLRFFSIRGQKINSSSKSIQANDAFPGPDGFSVYTDRGLRLDPAGNFREGFQGNKPGYPPAYGAFPTATPGYFLTLAGLVPHPSFPDEPISLTIRDDLEGGSLAILSDLPELRKPPLLGDMRSTDLTLEKRFHFVPSAKLLMTIPASNDRLVLRRVDLDALLPRNPGDWLVVTSPRLLRAEAGKPFRHQVQVKASRGTPKFSLAGGPVGLTVTSQGLIEWPSPSQAPGSDETNLGVNVLDEGNRVHPIPIRVQVR